MFGLNRLAVEIRCAELGLSMKELQKRAGVSHTVFYGKQRKISSRVAGALARALECKPLDILKEVEAK